MKIALLGAAPSSRLLAPFNDMEWEIWACSPPNYDLPRVDAWFELHSLARKMVPQNKPYFDLLANHQRVYFNHEDPLVGNFPNSIAYPFDAMVEKYGRYFFTSSLAWMMAFAIEQKPEKIGLWGVDMSAAEEYGYQRAGMHYFIQEAQKQGIKVNAAAQSDILAPVPLYGVKEQWPMWNKQRARRAELNERVAKCQQLIEKNKNEMLVLQGALDDINYVDNTWVQPS